MAHPETQDGEVFFCNCTDQHSGPHPQPQSTLWESIFWETKRRGQQAFSPAGKPKDETWYPVFIRAAAEGDSDFHAELVQKDSERIYPTQETSLNS